MIILSKYPRKKLTRYLLSRGWQSPSPGQPWPAASVSSPSSGIWKFETEAWHPWVFSSLNIERFTRSFKPQWVAAVGDQLKAAAGWKKGKRRSPRRVKPREGKKYKLTFRIGGKNNLELGEFTDDSTSLFCRPQRIGKLLGNHFKEFPISCGNFTIGKDNNHSPTAGLSEIVQRISCQHSCNVWISTPLRALFLQRNGTNEQKRTRIHDRGERLRPGRTGALIFSRT